MKINLSRTYKDLDGKSIEEDGITITLGRMICSSLLTSFQDEPNLSGADKAKRGNLAMSLYDKEEADISIEDVALIKQLVGKLGAPLVVAQSYSFLDPKPEDIKKEA